MITPFGVLFNVNIFKNSQKKQALLGFENSTFFSIIKQKKLKAEGCLECGRDCRGGRTQMRHAVPKR
jgi:hypothetical protein